MRSWPAATTIGLILTAIGPAGLRAEVDDPAAAIGPASPALRAVPDLAILVGPDAVQQLAVE